MSVGIHPRPPGRRRSPGTGDARAQSRLSAVAYDQYPLWLETIARVVESAGVELVGSATRIDEAIAMLESERPSLFVVGLEREVARRDEADALFEAASRVAGVSTIVVSSDDNPEFIQYCLQRGATYVLKTIRPDDLSSTIRQAVDRCVYLFGAPAWPSGSAGEKLTPRELDVLALVAEGLSNAQVANRLWISVATVKFHLAKTYEKLGVANRTGAVRWAQRNGLLSVETPVVPLHRRSAHAGVTRRVLQSPPRR
jgi:DNA-binding NarL/FixJ family response regulator